jgi:hypothetical protein
MRYGLIGALIFGSVMGAPAAFAQHAGSGHGAGGRGSVGVRPAGGPGYQSIRRNGPGYVGGYAPYPIYGAGYFYGPGIYDPAYGAYSSAEPYGPDGQYGQQGYDPQAPMPTVIINQNFQPDTVRPQIMDYSNGNYSNGSPQGPGFRYPPAPQTNQPYANQPYANQNQRANQNDGQGPAAENTYLLIAMKDHTIYPALAYWIEGDTLNYVAVGGLVNHASLSAIDRELSLKLNAGRRPDFRLP